MYKDNLEIHPHGNDGQLVQSARSGDPEAFNDQFREVDLLTSLRDSLKMIIEHARGKEIGSPEFAYGLSAYDSWKQIFIARKVDPLGNAYSLHYIKQAREFGVTFLQSLVVKMDMNCSKKLKELILHAVLVYSAVIEDLERLCSMFPFPSGGDPNEDNAAVAAIKLLSNVEMNEEAGIQIMEQMLDIISL